MLFGAQPNIFLAALVQIGTLYKITTLSALTYEVTVLHLTPVYLLSQKEVMISCLPLLTAIFHSLNLNHKMQLLSFLPILSCLNSKLEWVETLPFQVG